MWGDSNLWTEARSYLLKTNMVWSILETNWPNWTLPLLAPSPKPCFYHPQRPRIQHSHKTPTQNVFHSTTSHQRRRTKASHRLLCRLLRRIQQKNAPTRPRRPSMGNRTRRRWKQHPRTRGIFKNYRSIEPRRGSRIREMDLSIERRRSKSQLWTASLSAERWCGALCALFSADGGAPWSIDGRQTSLLYVCFGLQCSAIRDFFILATLRYWQSVDLDLFGVHPSFQRLGLGAKLLEWGLSRADQEGMEVFLSSSSEGRRLYQKHGFQGQGAYSPYHGYEQLPMIRSVQTWDYKSWDQRFDYIDSAGSNVISLSLSLSLSSLFNPTFAYKLFCGARDAWNQETET